MRHPPVIEWLSSCEDIAEKRSFTNRNKRLDFIGLIRRQRRLPHDSTETIILVEGDEFLVDAKAIQRQVDRSLLVDVVRVLREYGVR
jgi:hypothetical protein